MEVVAEAGRVDTSSGDGMKMTENPTMNEASEKMGSTGVDSRDRRKSKYLSYPYTNMGPRHKGLSAESEDLRTPCLSHKAETSSTTANSLIRTPSVAKSGGEMCRFDKTETSGTTPSALNRTPSGAKVGNKRFRRNWQRKFISCSAIPNSTEFINGSSAELLSGLYLKAADCMFPMEDKSFDLVEWFFCRYRISNYNDEAALATSMVNVNGENIGKPVENNLQDTKTEKRRVYNKRENTVRRKMKSLSGLSDVNTTSSTSDSLRVEGKLKQKRKVEEVTSLQQPQNVEITLNESNGKNSSVPEIPQISTSDSLRPEEKVKQKRKVEEVTQLQQPQNVEITFNASNGKHNSVPEVPQISASKSLRPGGKQKQKRKVEDKNLTCFASEKAVHKRRKKVEASPASQSAINASMNTGTQTTKCSTLVIDLQLISPSIPGPSLQKCNGENKEGLVLAGSNPKSCAYQEKHLGDLSNHDLLSNTTSKVGTVLANETGLKGKMEKVAEGHLSDKLAAEIPDLNCIVSEPNSTPRECENVNMISPGVKSEQPRIVSACEKPPETVNCSGVKDNKEADAACLLLQFTPGVHLPSKEDLMSTFFRFGPLKASETKLLDTSSAQIVFVRSADARSAFDSLGQSKPFGAAIVDYKLHRFPAESPPAEQQVMTQTQPPTRSTPMASVAHPPLHVIKQNLQMMASMLENSGNTLSPEMRTKLDNELKSLMQKVNSRVGSS